MTARRHHHPVPLSVIVMAGVVIVVVYAIGMTYLIGGTQ